LLDCPVPQDLARWKAENDPLGAGGMGEMYRTHDTTLHGDVAVKVLPEAIARQPI